MRIGLLRDFDKLGDHMRRRRQIGIAHAKVNNILAPRPRRRAHRIDFGDDIRRQAFDAVKFFGHDSISLNDATQRFMNERA